MTQKKIKIYIVIFSIISLSSLIAQNLTEHWQLIKTDEISDILIDFSKIVEYGNEISVWSLEKLNEAQTINDEEIFSIKTHFLFNKIKKRYTEIGIIYYDSKGGIVNRSSKSSFNGGPSAFMSPISSNPKCELIYNQVISYLITGSIPSINSDNIDSISVVINNNDSNLSQDDVSENDNEPNKNDVISIPNDDDEDLKEQMTGDETKSIEESISTKIDINDGQTDDSDIIIGETVEKQELDRSGIKDIQSNLTELDRVELSDFPEIKIPKLEYDQENERLAKNSIFTDGNLYCIQISSWKTRSIADKEVDKLVSRGFNAFIVSVKPKNKNGIWNRVRVGYFNSLIEAKTAQREINKH